MAKRPDTAPLDALRVLLNCCSMTLEPLTHQVNMLPEDAGLEYYFVTSQNMAQFEPYHHPGAPYKNLKLINYDRPAIGLTFFSKHKYNIDRDVAATDAVGVLQDYRQELLSRAATNALNGTQEREIQQIDTLLRAMRQNPDRFQSVTSNYHHNYQYWYCSFRYFEDAKNTKTGTHNEHMLKHTERRDRRTGLLIPSERLNVIFVDSEYITQPVPYDNKLIELELETYPDRIRFGKSTLYVKSLE